MTPWLLVLVAGLMETGWALGLKYSDGFTRPVPSVLTLVGAVASFWLLSLAMKSLPVGTAYAVWVASARWGRRSSPWRFSASLPLPCGSRASA